MLLIGIIGCVLPVIDSIVFEPNLPFVEIDSEETEQRVCVSWSRKG